MNARVFALHLKCHIGIFWLQLTQTLTSLICQGSVANNVHEKTSLKSYKQAPYLLAKEEDLGKLNCNCFSCLRLSLLHIPSQQLLSSPVQSVMDTSICCGICVKSRIQKPEVWIDGPTLKRPGGLQTKKWNVQKSYQTSILGWFYPPLKVV